METLWKLRVALAKPTTIAAATQLTICISPNTASFERPLQVNVIDEELVCWAFKKLDVN
jgi:hypothetical protein